MPLGKKIVTEAQMLGDEAGSAEKRMELHAVRMGLAQTGWAQTIEFTTEEMNSLREECANDGVFWGLKFAGKEPPPLDQRCGMGTNLTSEMQRIKTFGQVNSRGWIWWKSREAFVRNLNTD